MITDSQWQKIHDKYSKLMYTIARKISGDNAIASIEDNYQDLQIAALNAVKGFKKKTGREFDDFWGDKLFDQYAKTVLWNHKNSKGSSIVKRYPLTKGVVSTSENAEVLNMSDDGTRNYECSIFLDDVKVKLPELQREAVDTLLRCPSYITDTGKINITKLSKSLGLDQRNTKTLVDNLANNLKNKM